MWCSSKGLGNMSSPFRRSGRSAFLPRVQRMLLSPSLRFFMQPLEVGVQLVAIDPPDPSAPKLYGRKAPRADQGVHLRNAHAEVRRNIFEREEPRLESW